MTNWIWNGIMVSGGGFLGAICRYQVSSFLGRRFPSSLPYGTLAVNLIGAFLLGWIAGHSVSPSMKLLWGTGFMGAFTTFSTLKLESFNLLKQKAWFVFWFYLALSYSIGILLAFVGFYL